MERTILMNRTRLTLGLSIALLGIMLSLPVMAQEDDPDIVQLTTNFPEYIAMMCEVPEGKITFEAYGSSVKVFATTSLNDETVSVASATLPLKRGITATSDEGGFLVLTMDNGIRLYFNGFLGVDGFAVLISYLDLTPEVVEEDGQIGFSLPVEWTYTQVDLSGNSTSQKINQIILRDGGAFAMPIGIVVTPGHALQNAGLGNGFQWRPSPNLVMMLDRAATVERVRNCPWSLFPERTAHP